MAWSKLDEYRDILENSDESSLLRHIADPAAESPKVPFTERPAAAISAWSYRPPTAGELKRQQAQRIVDHRTQSAALLALAIDTADEDERARLHSMAMTNLALADTLQQLHDNSLDALETLEQRRAALNGAQKEIENELRGVVRDENPEKWEELWALRGELQRSDWGLSSEEMHAESQSRDAWQSLEAARREMLHERGRARLRAIEPSLRTRLCTEWDACQKIKKYEDEASLAMAIGDALTGLAALTSLPAATLAVLVVKLGVRRFCSCPA